MRVLVTGASRSLGKELAAQYLAAGDETWLLVRDAAQARELADAHPAACHVITGDLRDDGLRETVRRALDGQTLDLLINNAGPPAATVGLEDAALDETREHLDIHCLGVLRMVQGCVEALARGTAPIVVDITSRLASLTRMAAGEFADIHRSLSYPVAKAAQNMLTIQLARVLAPRGIRVVALHPGALLTGCGSADAATPVPDGARRIRELVARLPLERTGVYLDPDGNTIPW